VGFSASLRVHDRTFPHGLFGLRIPSEYSDLERKGIRHDNVQLIYGFALFMHFLAIISTGGVSDFFGRKKLTLYYTVFLVLFATPVYYVLYNAAIHRDVMMAIVGTTMAAMMKLAWGIIPLTSLNVSRRNGEP